MPSAVSLSDRTPHQPRRHFRADIQALRAIAVVLVVIYHLRPNRMPGGYVGVDVFFVISGFLITGHLIREASQTGRVKLGAFWAARARRILPASLVTIAVTIGLTAWLMPVTLFDDLRKQALGSIFYVQNWVLAADAVDYSAADNSATAFQHFWSLSIEEQFYLFWPLLVFVALWVVARRGTGRDAGARRDARDAGRAAAEGARRDAGDAGRAAAGRAAVGSPSARLPATESDRLVHERDLRRILTAIFGAVVLVSLAYSIFAVAGGHANAYFVTTTRVWELGAGGMLAVIGVGRINRAWRYLLGYLGLAAIIGSAVLLTNESPFPGLAALPVILGTVAVILAGTPGKDERSLAAYDPWTFGAKLGFVQWIGDRSYSLYLWHFPVIILWTRVTEHPLGYLDVFGMIVLSGVLAHLSFQFIEQPVRRAPYFTLSTRRSLIGGLVTMLVVAALTFAYPLMSGRAASGTWDDLARYAQSAPDLGAAAISNGDIPAFTTGRPAMTPSPLEANKDRNIAFSVDDCVAEASDSVTPRCSIGDADADTSVVLVGDSHARMYSTAFAEIATDRGWQLHTYLHNACPFNPTLRQREATSNLACTEPNAVVMDEILADPPDLVITTWFYNADYADDGAVGRPGSAGFADYWNTLEDAGIKVLVLRDVPRLSEDVPDCIAEHYDNPDACATPRKDALRGGKLLKDAAQLAPGATIADFTDLFCTLEVCKPVIGNVLVYKDRHHITDTYAVSMIPWLSDAVDEALATR